MKKMNPRIKLLWTTDLRSGQVKQWKNGALGNGAMRCCLGVLGDIAVREGVIDAPIADAKGNLVYDGSTCYLPISVAEWAGINTNGKYTDASSKDQYLSWQNDFGDDVDFPDIADLIDEHL